MEESELTDARENITRLERDYKELEVSKEAQGEGEGEAGKAK